VRRDSISLLRTSAWYSRADGRARSSGGEGMDAREC
jgi:hypothetical protein